MTDRANWAQARGNLYKFLSAAFLKPPTAVLVGPLLADGFLGGLEELFGTAAVADLREFASGFQGDYESLDREFQGLFMVPLGRYVTPYEAVYRDERVVDGKIVRGLLMGPSTLDVKGLYREAGLEVPADLLELPDHVGLELGCMQSLCEAEARAWEGADAEGAERAWEFQRRLLEEHLLQWVPAICARVRENAPGPFYRGIAALTEAFLRHEAEVAEKPETDRRAVCGRG